MRVFIFVLLALSFIGCKKTKCPAFESELLSYFPYSKGQNIIFKNDNNNTLTLKVNDLGTSDAYSIAWNSKCVCDVTGWFETEKDANHSLAIRGGFTVLPENNHYNLSCNISASMYATEFSTSRTVSLNNNYKDVIAAFGDSVIIENQEKPRFKSIKIIRNKGIVEFWDETEGCNWVKVE